MKRILVNLAVTITMLLAGMASAETIYTGYFSNKAVGGYDTVAYFTEGKAVEGARQFKHKWRGADWHFSSAENLELFKEMPERYAPQYGGHCAWAVAARNDLYKGDPEYWKIVDGKLYLNYDSSVQERWLKDVPGFITKGDKNWPALNNN